LPGGMLNHVGNQQRSIHHEPGLVHISYSSAIGQSLQFLHRTASFPWSFPVLFQGYNDEAV